MKFKLFGTEVYVSFLFIGVITLMLCFDKTGFILPMLFSVFVHEFGHLFMMWVTGETPLKIRLIPASVQIVSGFSGGYRRDVLVALSGPVMNFVFFGVFYYNYACFGNECTLMFSVLNLIIGVFNLLPVKGLDGGTVVYSLLSRVWTPYKALFCVRCITAFLGAVALAGAVILSVSGKLNVSLYIMALYLIITAIIKT